MRYVTTVKVARRGKSPYWVVSGYALQGRQVFKDYADADRYHAQLAYGPASDYALAA
jgi:uncharacterized membrane protein